MEPSVGTVIASRYRVLKELGRGGMGAVYLVEHVNTGEQLALKALLSHVGAHAELVERFRREARTPSRIRSEHVVRVTDADAAPELGGAPFMVMELLEGRDLDQRLIEGGPLSPAELLNVLTPVAGVLDQAHALGIVHRDLKPENLFLHHLTDGTMVVKVVDFGIAKLLDNALGADARLTGTGTIMGTPMYMAPEQARGDIAAIGPATDIWAIGQIAFNALSGESYWSGPSAGEVVAQILTAPMDPPSRRAPSISPAFDAWFARSCAKDPRQRWPSAGAQIASLSEALSGVAASPTAAATPFAGATPTVGAAPVAVGPITVAQSTPDKTTGSRSTGRGWLVGLGLLIAAAAGAGGAVMVLGKSAKKADDHSHADETKPDRRLVPSAKHPAPSTPRPAPEPPAHGKPKVTPALNDGAPGSYEPKQLLAILEPRLPETLACYTAELEEQPKLTGTVFLTLLLAADQRPMSATCVPQMQGGSPRTLCPCLQGKVTSWAFPPPKRKLPMISVGYKLHFSVE